IRGNLTEFLEELNKAMRSIVSFDKFWGRLGQELIKLPQKNGLYVGKVKKWSQGRNYFGGEFWFVYRGGKVIECQTEATGKLRSVSSAEFKRVYAIWNSYRSGKIGRKHITHDLGLQNSSWVIPILRKYESLMT